MIDRGDSRARRITTGAVYALLALALVLVFSVTRVIFIWQGEFVSYGALTLATLQANKLPSTAGIRCGLLRRRDGRYRAAAIFALPALPHPIHLSQY